MVSSGAGVRNKGARGERELAKLLGEAMGADLTRNLNQWREGGPDLLSAALPWLALEVKRCETVTLGAWWRQATAQATPGQIPALAYRQSRRPWQFIIPLAALDDGAPPSSLVTLDLDGFIWWLRRRLGT